LSRGCFATLETGIPGEAKDQTDDPNNPCDPKNPDRRKEGDETGEHTDGPED
jgi:hypothetical protein